MLNVSVVRSILPDIDQIEEIKVGGQKAVFRAEHKSFGSVIVKVLRPKGSIERMTREVTIVRQNDFTNVPKIFDYNECTLEGDKCLYLIEQLIEGQELRKFIDGIGHFTINEACSLLHHLLETILDLELARVVHRDIKPENIIRTAEDKYWLLDFGIARDLDSTSLTLTEANFGPHTVGYAAPEQFRNMKKKIDSRTDLFSVGVVLYEAITGNHPFAQSGMNPLEVLSRTETLSIDNLNIEGDTDDRVLSRFILNLMQKFPSRRPPSGRQAWEWFSEIKQRVKGGV